MPRIVSRVQIVKLLTTFMGLCYQGFRKPVAQNSFLTPAPSSLISSSHGKFQGNSIKLFSEKEEKCRRWDCFPSWEEPQAPWSSVLNPVWDERKCKKIQRRQNQKPEPQAAGDRDVLIISSPGTKGSRSSARPRGEGEGAVAWRKVRSGPALRKSILCLQFTVVFVLCFCVCVF